MIELLRAMAGAFANRSRAFLTLLGIVIGTSSIILLASLIGSGKNYLVEQNQSVSGDDIIVIRPKKVGAAADQKTTRELSRTDADELAQTAALGGVLVATEQQHDVDAHVGDRTKWIGLVSTGEQTFSLNRLKLASGRLLDDEDRRAGRNACVVGHEVYEDLLHSAPLGPNLTLTADGHMFIVVGVLARKPTLGSGNSTWAWDRKVMIPSTLYDTIYAPNHKVDRIYVRAPASKEARVTARSAIMGVLLRRHLGIANFEIRKDESGGTEDLVLMVIQVLLLGTGVMALLASGINIMNVMLVSVSERTREIGLRRAIGATPNSILTQFLVEASTLGLVGGAVGVVTGVLFSWLVALAARAQIGSWDFMVPGWSIGLGMALAVVTGVVFGILPAMRAARVSPIEALRSE